MEREYKRLKPLGKGLEAIKCVYDRNFFHAFQIIYALSLTFPGMVGDEESKMRATIGAVLSK